MLYAKITEEDIMAGKLVSRESKIKCIVSRLDKLADGVKDPYEGLE